MSNDRESVIRLPVDLFRYPAKHGRSRGDLILPERPPAAVTIGGNKRKEMEKKEISRIQRYGIARQGVRIVKRIGRGYFRTSALKD